jgi:hypothetical protein
MCSISFVHTALDEDGKSSNPALAQQLSTMMKQLDWYTAALKNHRETAGVMPRNLGD